MENSMISATEVSMNYGEQTLFENVNVVFNPGERYGLTGQMDVANLLS